MDWGSMKAFGVDNEIERMLADIDESVVRLRNTGDFSPAVVDEIAREFLPDDLRSLIDQELLVGRIEDTLAIESIIVNPRVTTSVLEGNALDDVDRYTKQAILNVHAANSFVENEARQGSKLSKRLICEVNRLIEVDGGESSRPGSFREKQVEITGAQIQPPHWSEVHPMLDEAIDIVNLDTVHPVVAASFMHWAVARIHPFENGNGRTARLCQDFLLIRRGFLPTGIPKAKRNEYYRALEDADLGDGRDLVILTANAQLATLSKAFEIASRPARRQRKISQYVDSLQKKAQSTEAKKYELWRGRAELFKSEVKRILEEVNVGQDHLKFRMYEQSVPEVQTWKQMLTAGGASKCQLLRIEVYLGGVFSFKMLWFAKRHRMDWISSTNRHLREEVGFFLDVCEGQYDQYETFKPLLGESYISLREVIPTSPNWTYAMDPRVTSEYANENINVSFTNPNWTLESAVTLGEIVELYIDGVMKKLGE
jgi:Fic family protein